MEILGEGVELPLPKAAVAGDPGGGVLHRARRQPAPAHPALAAAVDQPGALQHAQVLGDRGEGNTERLSQRCDGGLAGGEAGQDRAARGVGQRAEGGVQGGRLILNHVVKHNPAPGVVKGRDGRIVLDAKGNALAVGDVLGTTLDFVIIAWVVVVFSTKIMKAEPKQ